MKKYEIELNSLKQESKIIKEPYKFQYNLIKLAEPQVRRAQYSSTNFNLNQYNYYENQL